MKVLTPLLLTLTLLLAACAKTPPVGISRQGSDGPHLLDQTVQAIAAERPAVEHHYSLGGVVQEELANRLTQQIRQRVDFDQPWTIPDTLRGLGFTCPDEAAVLRCSDSTVYLSYMPGYFGYQKRREDITANVTVDRSRRAIDTAVNIKGAGY